MNRLLSTKIKIVENHDAKKELTVCLHPNKEKLLFLDHDYNGYFVDIALVNKFSFDEKHLYLKMGNSTIAFVRIPDGGTDEDFKELIRAIKTVKNEVTEGSIYPASAYLDKGSAFGAVDKTYLLNTGVSLYKEPEPEIKQPVFVEMEEGQSLGGPVNEQELNVDEEMEFIRKQIQTQIVEENKAQTPGEIIKEISKMDFEELVESVNTSHSEIPEGFKLVDTKTVDNIPPYANPDSFLPKEEQNNLGNTIVASKEELQKSEAKLADENVSKKKKKKKKKASKTLFILFIVLLITVLVALGVLSYTGNIEYVLDLLPLNI